MRIVALSDQHGHLPEIPPCDLLIIAGDVCPDGFGRQFAMDAPELQKAWFDQTIRPWVAMAPATRTILTWGNHDWCGQLCTFDDPSSAASATALTIVVDDATRVPSGGVAGQTITVWASPWSNQFGDWAFMKAPAELVPVYAAIPEGIDILVSHQPPFGYGDRCADFISGRIISVGSRELLATIDRVRPKIVVCGHIHEGYGQFERNGARILNASVVDEHYRLVRGPTVVDL
jgi:Icc-related predicted phosphoesterase